MWRSATKAISIKQLRTFCKALELRPDYAEVHNNLGLVFHDQARLGAAVTHFERALAIKP